MKFLIDCEQPSSHYLCPFDKEIDCEHPGNYPCLISSIEELHHAIQQRAQKHKKTIIRLETARN